MSKTGRFCRTQVVWVASLALLLLMLGACRKKAESDFQGYVEGDFVHVASSEPGRLEQLQVARGDTVAAGAPLFVLESEKEAAAARQAQEQLRAAEAQLKDIQEGKRPQEVDVIREQLAQAKAEAKKAAAQLIRDQAQVAAGGIPQSQLDRSQAAATATAARVREWKGQIDVANLPAREEQIQAQAAQVAAAQALWEQAKWRLDQKTQAASDSAFVSDTLYNEGEWVPAGRPVVRLLPPGNVKIRFFVPEAELGRIAMGQEVKLACDGCETSLTAKVTYVAEEAEYTPPIIYSNETRSKLVFMVEALPVSGAETLHPGQPVQVKLP
jgi:HlyD family secretion protein